MEKLKLKKGNERRIRNGHLWVFSNELQEVPKLEPGSTVEVVDITGRSYGVGFYNPNSLIAVRMLLSTNAPDTAFFKARIESALNLRKRMVENTDMYRLVFGESDFLPGLIVDKFGDYFSLQSLSVGIEKNIQQIIDALIEVFPDTNGIIAKNTSKLRELEHLPLGENVLYGNVEDNIILSENGVKYNISLTEGQKTGFFLDQRENRNYLKRLSKGMKVLDCFTNQGGFALNTAMAGAKKVIGVDISDASIERAESNAKLNNFDNVTFEKADVAEYLQTQIGKTSKFNMIILDPPAYTKSKKNIFTALAGYAKINKMALRLLSKGGFLVSSSCSQHITDDMFLDTIAKEGAKAERQLNLVYRGSQGSDHPILMGMPETRYLKFFVFSVS
jgi:23S rRNA (cytosine1962-C5)-methyltransferase